MAKKRVSKSRKRIKALGKIYPQIKASELAEIAEDLGANIEAEAEDIRKLARKINHQFRHP